MIKRTHTCGQPRLADAGATVALNGWVNTYRDQGRGLLFIDLRDRDGLCQVVFDLEQGHPDVVRTAKALRREDVVGVRGKLRKRAGDANPKLATGEVELVAEELEVFNKAENPPILPDEHEAERIGEETRLKYRYIDLRRPRMQQILRTRSAVTKLARDYFAQNGFVEIETPLLIKSTPEGARDFIVPSRLHPGSWYALPQSPQLFKQLCMVGGVDRYYQVARCLRDEDLRADRQFEFTQLDAEMSFAGQEDVLEVITAAVDAAVRAVRGEGVGEVPRITWREAIDRFGSDKPDVRFGMELVELTDLFAETEFQAFRAGSIKGIRHAGASESTSRSRLDDLTATCKRWGAKGLVWMRVEAGDDGAATLVSPVAKFMSASELAGVAERLGAEVGDVLYLVADEWLRTTHVLGLLRLELGRPPTHEGGLRFLWVVDFPLFEDVDDATGRPVPAHHPFTMPHDEDLSLLDGDAEALLRVRSQAYDLVLNGWELGSGSVRIHRGDLQQRIFDLLGISQEEAASRFGFLLDAFRFGAPPHAGFAFGVDRLVALLLGEDNIREVIAFPKTQSGTDPLTGAPSTLDDTQLAELGLRHVPPPS
jgi:aspartyl-tRNA synthetase